MVFPPPQLGHVEAVPLVPELAVVVPGADPARDHHLPISFRCGLLLTLGQELLPEPPVLPVPPALFVYRHHLAVHMELPQQRAVLGPGSWEPQPRIAYEGVYRRDLV